MLHRTLAFAVQYVKLSASDIQLTFSQQDEPGPAPTVGLHVEGKDSLQLSIRQVSLAPQGVLKPVSLWRSYLMCKNSSMHGPLRAAALSYCGSVRDDLGRIAGMM